MATKCKSDDPAFPFVVPSNHIGWHGGLTKREYFAAKALAAIIGSPDASGASGTWSDLAGCAVRAADAMITELNRKAGE
jgi:hypothetical protein